jgi:hypothetical protein
MQDSERGDESSVGASSPTQARTRDWSKSDFATNGVELSENCLLNWNLAEREGRKRMLQASPL